MSLIFYKFKSLKEYDAFKFEGNGVSVWELKKEIIKEKRLTKATDYELILNNAQTKEGRTFL